MEYNNLKRGKINALLAVSLSSFILGQKHEVSYMRRVL